MNNEAYEETHDTWNKVASLYQEKFMNLDLYNASYDKFLQLLPPSSSLLELGCGPGNISHYLLRKNPELKMLLTDVSPEMINLARRNNPGAECRVMDARELGNIRRKFDGAVAGFCLPYLSLEDVQKLFLEISEALTENGIFYLSALKGNYDQSGFESGSNGRVFVYYYTQEILEQMLHAADFKVLYNKDLYYERKNNTETHFVLIAGKRKNN